MHFSPAIRIVFTTVALGAAGCGEPAVPEGHRPPTLLVSVEIGARPLGSKVGPLISSSPMIVYGRARGAEPPNRTAFVSVMDKPRNREPAAQRSAIGNWLPATIPGEWEFEAEVRGLTYPGEYTIVVRHGTEVLGEAPITVSAAAE